MASQLKMFIDKATNTYFMDTGDNFVKRIYKIRDELRKAYLEDEEHTVYSYEITQIENTVNVDYGYLFKPGMVYDLNIILSPVVTSVGTEATLIEVQCPLVPINHSP